MSDRERWIVYPLIFLTLGIALRDKITRTLDEMELIAGDSVQLDLKYGQMRGEDPSLLLDFAQGQLSAETIRCRQLVVEEQVTTKRVIAQQSVAREVLVMGPDETVRVLIESVPSASKAAAPGEAKGGRLIVFGPSNEPQVVLSPGSSGGQVAVVDKTLRLRLNFGNFTDGVILEAETGGQRKTPLLRLPPTLTPPAETQNDPTPGPPEPEE